MPTTKSKQRKTPAVKVKRTKKARPMRLREETVNGKHKYYIKSNNVNFYFPEGLSKQEALKRALKLRTRKRRRRKQLTKKANFQPAITGSVLQTIPKADGSVEYRMVKKESLANGLSPLVPYQHQVNRILNKYNNINKVYELMDKESMTDTDRRQILDILESFGHRMPAKHNKSSLAGFKKVMSEFNNPRITDIADGLDEAEYPRIEDVDPSLAPTPKLPRIEDVPEQATEQSETFLSAQSKMKLNPPPEPAAIVEEGGADNPSEATNWPDKTIDAPADDGDHPRIVRPEVEAKVKAEQADEAKAIPKAVADQAVDKFVVPNYKEAIKLRKRLKDPIDMFPVYQRRHLVNTAIMNKDLLKRAVEKLNKLKMADLQQVASDYGLDASNYTYKAPVIELILRNSSEAIVNLTAPDPPVKAKKKGKGQADVQSEQTTEPSRALKDLKHVGLYDLQINDMMQSYVSKGYLGCVMRDQISSLIPNSLQFNKFGFVMNTATSHEDGVHWVAVYVDTMEDGELCYFDPYGEDPPQYFARNIKQLLDAHQLDWYLKFKINRLVQQDARSSTCGMHSLLWLRSMLDGKSFVETTGWDVRKHEKKAQDMFKKYSRFGYI